MTPDESASVELMAGGGGKWMGSITGSGHFVTVWPAYVVGAWRNFTIIDDTAWIGAHLDGNDPPDIAFQVVDNGEGSKADPDEVGLFVEGQLFGLPPGFANWWCDATPIEMDFGPGYGVAPVSVLRSPIVAGNVQIKGN